MQISLPVHQAAGHQEVFDGVNAFGFYYQVIVFYIKHFDDAGGPDIAFGYTGIETVTPQIVQTIHIQLTADQLVQEFLGIFIFEYLYGKIELTFHVLVHSFHQHQGDFFM